MQRNPRRFHVSVVFPVPPSFAYAWCTDYTPEDGKYAGEDRSIGLTRRIVQRTRRRVIFENLYNVGNGWGWERHTVRLSPPDRWHSDGIGSFHESHLDYRLSEPPGDQTKFDMSWTSSPMPWHEGGRTPREVVENYVVKLWQRRAKPMSREYTTQHRNKVKGRRP